MPMFHKLKRADLRKAFFEAKEFEAVRQRLRPDVYKVAAMMACVYGLRTQTELLTLGVAQHRPRTGTLRLDPGTTKNDDGARCLSHAGTERASG